MRWPWRRRPRSSWQIIHEWDLVYGMRERWIERRPEDNPFLRPVKRSARNRETRLWRGEVER